MRAWATSENNLVGRGGILAKVSSIAFQHLKWACWVAAFLSRPIAARVREHWIKREREREAQEPGGRHWPLFGNVVAAAASSVEDTKEILHHVGGNGNPHDGRLVCKEVRRSWWRFVTLRGRHQPCLRRTLPRDWSPVRSASIFRLEPDKSSSSGRRSRLATKRTPIHPSVRPLLSTSAGPFPLDANGVSTVSRSRSRDLRRWRRRW